jgi:hypothetical protein
MPRLVVTSSGNPPRITVTDFDTKATFTGDTFAFSNDAAAGPIFWLGIYNSVGTFSLPTPKPATGPLAAVPPS